MISTVHNKIHELYSYYALPFTGLSVKASAGYCNTYGVCIEATVRRAVNKWRVLHSPRLYRLLVPVSGAWTPYAPLADTNPSPPHIGSPDQCHRVVQFKYWINKAGTHTLCS